MTVATRGRRVPSMRAATAARTAMPAAAYAATLLAAWLVAGCSYSPHFVSGVTGCADSPPLCPSGYTCDLATGRCVTGTSDAGAMDAPGDQSSGGTGGMGGGAGGGTGGAGGNRDGGGGDAAADAPHDTAAGGAGGMTADAGSDGACTADIATSPDNCGACGHSCGGGICDRGVCQPMVLPGISAASSISVDATRIYYSSSTKLLACPKSGCVLQPTQLDDMGATGYSIWSISITNGSAFFMSAPTQAGTEHDDLFMCSLTGCPSPAPTIATARYGVSYLTNSGNDVYWADSDIRTTSRRTCMPNAGACDTPVTILSEAIALHAFAARADEFYFADAMGVQKCPWAGCPGTPPVPTPTPLTPLLPTALVYYGGKLYMQFGDAMHTLNGAIRTCDPVDCTAHTPATFVANRDPISGLNVDADGVYWMEDGTLYSCPLAGCVGGAKTVATGITRVPNQNLDNHLVVTDNAFIYWINDDLGTLKRIAK